LATPSSKFPSESARIDFFPELHVFYTDHYHFPLPQGHKFPLEKYRLLREALSPDPRFVFHPAPFVAQRDLLRVHDPGYVDGFLQGTLERSITRRIGFPWSAELVDRTLASAGATVAATGMALETGFGGTLAGGTHHAFRSEGSGFCVFNDLAVSIEWARANAGLTRFAVIDCDVHQGDGTAAIFESDPSVFTLSLHGARNFPFRKQRSMLDVELPDECGDEAYLAALAPALRQVWGFGAQLILFQSGVDGLLTDRLGRLRLTLPGLLERDRMVITQTRERGLPLVITLGGGYSEPITNTVAAHAQTFLMAADILVSSTLIERP
jgi:acetoin utilization deacetylase AcuC-like enzyme